MKLFRIAAVVAITTGSTVLIGSNSASATPPKITKPGKPVAPSALGLNTAIRVAWRPPPSDGGSPITGYTVTFAPGPKTCNSKAAIRHCTVGGLTNGQKYIITVRASNAKGTGNSPFPVQATPNTRQDCSYAGLYANLQGCNPVYATLVNANLTNDNLTGANLEGQSLQGAKLTNTNFLDTNLIEVSSGGIVGTPINLPMSWGVVDGYLVGQGADLSDSDLSGVDLSGLDLSPALVQGSGGDTRPTDFVFSDLSNADLTGTNLPDALFAGANLTDVNMTDANLEGAQMTNGTTLTDITWSDTICPDGTNSDNDGSTCVNDLSF